MDGEPGPAHGGAALALSAVLCWPNAAEALMPNLYYSARARLLRQEMDWRDDNKYLVLLGDGFVFSPFNQSLNQIGAVHWEASKLSNPTVTLTGWAGSPPATFLALTWNEPVYRALLTEVADGADPFQSINHKLICDLDNVIQAPFHTDGFDKQVGFDTSQGAEGWFSP
jgi:hypothetical protein